MKPSRPWQNWLSIDLALLVIVVLGMIGLFIMAAFLPLRSHASACLSIDVPPGAVINQPDGDTFHVFAFQPGGVVKIRVEGVDTPERHEPKWAEAKAFTRAWLAKGPFKVSTCGKPTIDRIVGTVERDGETLAQALKGAQLVKE